MYYLFVKRNLLPGEYYRLPAGEQVVLRAFFEIEMDALFRGASGNSDFASLIDATRR